MGKVVQFRRLTSASLCVDVKDFAGDEGCAEKR